ncbi:kinase-like protein [Coprinellus micaceus]|uniref:Kinase-like protein n=1 Tax=Coprinellus micaceus TaxID=71717 RepID=A0A4Y7SZS6_COPMI|nr:kinase-like protein [Coprinellus micaceus]
MSGYLRPPPLASSSRSSSSRSSSSRSSYSSFGTRTSGATTPSSIRSQSSNQSATSSASFSSAPPGVQGIPDRTNDITLLDKNYVAGGGFSYIYLGLLHRSNGSRVKVAIKVIRDTGLTQSPEFQMKLERRLERESKLWYSSFNHENIIRLYGLARDPALSSVVSGLVFPWCEHGTVLQYVNKYQKSLRVPLIRGVASGLHYIHAMDAVHGDIKSANVLMSNEGKPLLTDFGCSKVLGVDGYTTELKSSLMYLSPELMDILGLEFVDSKGKKQKGTPTTKASDVWAFGLVGAEILGGSEVFSSIRQLHLPSYVCNGGRPKKTDYPNLSREADSIWPLLEICWSAEPGDRLTMDEVIANLR